MKTMEKIAMSIKNNKLAISASVATQCILAGVTPAFASSSEPTAPVEGLSDIGARISAALVNGISRAITDTVEYITAILPYGLTIFGTVWGCRKAISFFKTAAGGNT